eukprot:12400451-Alexandrium_andersonii.AAC.1
MQAEEAFTTAAAVLARFGCQRPDEKEWLIEGTKAIHRARLTKLEMMTCRTLAKSTHKKERL